MREILRKLYRHQNIDEAEYAALMDYADELRTTSPESYQLFYQRFATILFLDYYTYLPRFAHGPDDLYNYLVSNPAILAALKIGPLAIDSFPPHLREYLQWSYPEGQVIGSLLPALDFITTDNAVSFALPSPRRRNLICKYEEANPYKELGLKSHFDRIGRYSFVSRLQSVRYLRGSKASEDKIETVSSDCLGGVFTNKEKSIYYYIFLTEADDIKAGNACQFLNQALYGN